jgi:putative spermidine/putrescine transport system permease protein
MYFSNRSKFLLKIISTVVFAFLYIPLLVILVNSFNTSKTFAWPPAGFTTSWWGKAIENDGVRAALITSVKAGLGAMSISLLLGSMVAFAVARYQFFGREAISLLVVLPIALPGIITGIALNSAFRTTLEPLGIPFGLLTVIIGHATFCIVVVYNNVLARLKRVGKNLEEASADLGAGNWQTFRYVTFPSIRSALAAGALLAFALSFDEIVVTTFTSGAGIQTLPQWIFDNLFRPNQAPIINVVAAMLIALFALPVWLSQRLSEGAGSGRI